MTATLPVAVGIELDGDGAHPAAWRAAHHAPDELLAPARLARVAVAAEEAGFSFATLGGGPARGRLPERAGPARPGGDRGLPRRRHLAARPRRRDRGRGRRAVPPGQPPREPRLGRAGSRGVGGGRAVAADAGEVRDVVDAVRTLWDTWEDGVFLADERTGRFLDLDRWHYADFRGEHFSIKGPVHHAATAAGPPAGPRRGSRGRRRARRRHRRRGRRAPAPTPRGAPVRRACWSTSRCCSTPTTRPAGGSPPWTAWTPWARTDALRVIGSPDALLRGPARPRRRTSTRCGSTRPCSTSTCRSCQRRPRRRGRSRRAAPCATCSACRGRPTGSPSGVPAPSRTATPHEHHEYVRPDARIHLNLFQPFGPVYEWNRTPRPQDFYEFEQYATLVRTAERGLFSAVFLGREPAAARAPRPAERHRRSRVAPTRSCCSPTWRRARATSASSPPSTPRTPTPSSSPAGWPRSTCSAAVGRAGTSSPRTTRGRGRTSAAAATWTRGTATPTPRSTSPRCRRSGTASRRTRSPRTPRPVVGRRVGRSPVVRGGRFHDLDAVPSVPRSPQGQTVYFQAGDSDEGRDFAARRAEGVFTHRVEEHDGVAFTADLRRRARAHGRPGDDIMVFPGAFLVVAETDARGAGQGAALPRLPAQRPAHPSGRSRPCGAAT